MATLYAGSSLSRFSFSLPSRAHTAFSPGGVDALVVSAPICSRLSRACSLSKLQTQWGRQHVHRSRRADTCCIASVGARHSLPAARPAKPCINPPRTHPVVARLGSRARQPDSEESRDEAKKRAGPVHQVGWAMLATLLYAAPAQAAKYIPSSVGLSDTVPVTDDFTVEDLGGLAMLGIILLLVFLVGNIVLPSMMFSDVDTAVPYKRDEEGDFYHDPSFTKDFFREARKTNDDIDEVPWSQAPFSKLAHEFSKVLPPPSSVAAPPELSKKTKKGLEHLDGPIGDGVKLSGIVSVPGYGSSVHREGQVEIGQAASVSYVTRNASTSGSPDDSDDATAMEGGASARGSVGAVREASNVQGLKWYKLDMKATTRIRPGRTHERAKGFGRHRFGGRHLND